MRVSVLDLGSNSFRLLVADVGADGSIQPVLRERELLHLGAELAERATLSKDAVDRAIWATKHLHDLGVRTGADRSRAVATAAIRAADNRDEILTRLGEAAGGPVRLLDGAEEARLGFLGVAASVALPDGPHLTLDLGGGSLELAVGTDQTVAWSSSVDVGATRVHSQAVRHDPPTDDDIARVEATVREAIAPLVPEIQSRTPLATVAIGGPIRSLARVVAARTLGWAPRVLNQFYIAHDEVRAVADQLNDLTERGRLDVEGVKESRAAQIGTSAVILRSVYELLGLERVWVSYWGLREGVILDEFGTADFPTGWDLRANAVHRMATRFGSNEDHTEHVVRLADSLFAQTRRLHGLTNWDRELLAHAARLHTVGMSVSFNGYARHGAYLIENAELRGFSPTEVAMLASLVRFHRRGTAKRDYPPYSGLTRTSQSRLDALVSLLHLADVLDRSLDQSIGGIELSHDRGVVHAHLIGQAPHLRRDWATSAVGSLARTLDVAFVFDDAQLIDAV